MRSQHQKIGIVIPAYNEEQAIGEVLSKMPRLIDQNPVQIIVVNDGSQDATADTVAKFRHVTLINHIINSGVGAATRTGIHYALDVDCDVIATIDADGQHRVVDLVRVIKTLLEDKSDLVIGSRLRDIEGMVWYRLIGNLGLSLFTYIIFGAWVTDSQSGLKAFSRRAAEQITFHSDNYAFCSEIVWRAKQCRLRINEIPIRAIYTNYSLSKGQSNLNSLNILGQMLKQRVMGFLHG